MAVILSLEKLYNDVIDLFIAEQTIAPTDPETRAAMPFGWREPPRQLRAPNRIVWTPGDPSGDLGPLEAPRFPGRIDPGRPLANLGELFHCTISAQDPTDPENEILQWKAARLLFDAWWRAVYLSASTQVKMRGARWVVDKNERRYGASIQAICRIDSMIPDEIVTLAPTDVHAEIDVTMLDVTDPTLTINPA